MVGLDECQLLFGGDLGSACVNDLWICTGGEWRQIFGHSDTGSAPAGRYGHAGCVQGSRLYIFGGADRYQQTSMFGDLWILDLVTLRWQRGPDGPSARYGHSMVAVDNSIFVIGGMTQNGLAADVWHLCTGEDHELSWTLMSPASKDQVFLPRTEFFATELSRFSVLLFGGSSTQAPLNDMWILNLNTEQALYTSVCLQISSALPVPRHAFGAITTSTGTISSAHASEVASEFGERDHPLIWLTDLGSAYVPDHTKNGSHVLFNGSFIKLYIFGGRGSDSSLNDLWECTVCSLEEAGTTYGIQETKIAEQNRLNNLGGSFSNINYPPNSDIDLYRSGDSFEEYNSRTLGGQSTDMCISNLADDKSLLYDKPSIHLPTDSQRPSVPRFPETREERPSINRRVPSARASDAQRASFVEHNSINDPSLLSNNVSREDHDASESMTPLIHKPQQSLVRETFKQQSRPSSGGVGSPYRMVASNPDQLVQPTDDVQKYLLTQMVTINENLLKMEAAFEAAELARKFSEELAEQSSAVDDLALAVSEFKNDVMHAIEGLSQKLSGYAVTQQGHEEDIVELNGKINELDNLIIEQANDTTRDELFMEMQVRINNLTKENKVLTARLTNVESLLIAITLASNPTDEILTLLNAVANQSAALPLNTAPAPQTLTDMSKEGFKPNTHTTLSSSQITGATLQGVFDEIQEMGKKLNALSSSIGSKSQLSVTPNSTTDEKVVDRFDQFRQQVQPQKSRQSQLLYQSGQVVPRFNEQQRGQHQLETKPRQRVAISPHSAIPRTSAMSRSSGSLSAHVTGGENRESTRPMSAFLSSRGRSRSSSASRGPNKESLAMIEKVLNAPDELSED